MDLLLLLLLLSLLLLLLKEYILDVFGNFSNLLKVITNKEVKGIVNNFNCINCRKTENPKNHIFCRDYGSIGKGK